MKKIVFDIETEGVFTGPLHDPSKLELTVIGLYDSETDKYSSYLKDELHKVWLLFEKADAIIGYNSDHFDIPILNKYYSGDLGKLKSVDLLKEIKNALGRRLRLDNVAEATLGRKKTASGLEAVSWWEKGEVEKVREYCIADVAITKDIYEYALKNGCLKYRDFDGIRDIKLDTSGWEKPADSSILTHTLPF